MNALAPNTIYLPAPISENDVDKETIKAVRQASRSPNACYNLFKKSIRHQDFSSFYYLIRRKDQLRITPSRSLSLAWDELHEIDAQKPLSLQKARTIFATILDCVVDRCDERQLPWHIQTATNFIEFHKYYHPARKQSFLMDLYGLFNEPALLPILFQFYITVPLSKIISELFLSACQFNDSHRIEELLNDPNLQINYFKGDPRMTALDFLLLEENFEMIDLLLRRGAQVTESILADPIASRETEKLQFLLSHPVVQIQKDIDVQIESAFILGVPFEQPHMSEPSERLMLRQLAPLILPLTQTRREFTGDFHRYMRVIEAEEEATSQRFQIKLRRLANDLYIIKTLFQFYWLS